MPRSETPRAVAIGHRVLLRPLSVADKEEFLALARSSAAFLAPWVSPPTRADQFSVYLGKCRRSDYRGLLACRRSDSTLLGSISISQIVRGRFRSAYLDYWIGARFARQGYMTDALRLAVRYAFRRLKLHRVEANIQPENTASLRLVKRLGFLCEGYSRRYLRIDGKWKDHERWAVLAEDWPS